MTNDLRVGFLGAGRMATALARGWLSAELVSPQQISASDPLPAARAAFAADLPFQTTSDNRSVVSSSTLLVIAVKPQMVGTLMAEIRPVIGEQHLILSIAAGTTLDKLAEGLGPNRRLVRIMPNTPCLVGASASAYAPGPFATEEDIQLVDRLLQAVGRAFRVPESLLNAVTGLSGSGPAFVYLVIEALADGGVKAGLPREVAAVLAAQTVLGAARMVLETNLHPGALKDMVASPAGTTIAGIHALEQAGIRGAFMDAVEAAAQRADELGKK